MPCPFAQISNPNATAAALSWAVDKLSVKADAVHVTKGGEFIR